ncbi:RloB family protein [Streptomyces sp. P38-E01]|uniref:RloB family protein n=1 Tax=Streptomyces tardus TaxID=2780544 RepID=A0A949N3G1_9ACTN|nr:RloB family protein [Streptomyces tardus]MBU7596824.1 RloB family protein [Streptomyces tardus]
MARQRGKDDTRRRPKGAGGRARNRVVHIFAEGEVTEEQYLDLVMAEGTPKNPAETAVHRVRTSSVATKDRKPLPLVDLAVAALRKAEREAEQGGLTKKHWAWPQVWVLFDRDDHKQIPTAFSRAREAGVQVAYSHPCFELWRLLHYKNRTVGFGGGKCHSASSALRSQPGFAKTYGHNVRSVSEDRAKKVVLDQIKGGYADARKFAAKLNEQHTGPDQSHWDPYTNVYELIEDGLGLSGY